MASNISVKTSTINSLQIIFAYQGQQLIRKIGKKKGWTQEEIDDLIKEFINKKNLKINVLTEPISRRGNKNLNLKMSERCIAMTANEEQCSRRRNTSDPESKYQLYCGIHLRKVKSKQWLSYGTIKIDELNEQSNKDSEKTDIIEIEQTVLHTLSSRTENIDIDTNIELDENDLYEIGSTPQNSDIEEKQFYPLGNNVNDSEDSEDEITVSEININGIDYLIDYNTSNVYSYDEEEFIGKYNINKNKINFNSQ